MVANPSVTFSDDYALDTEHPERYVLTSRDRAERYSFDKSN